MVKRSLVNSVTNYYIFLTGLPSCENHTACHSDRLAPISGKVIGLMRRDDAALASVTILAKIEGSDRELQLELSESFYAKKVHAHLARRKISCYGEVVKNGEAIVVRNVRDLRVV